MKKSQLIILLIPILLATGLIQYSKIHGQMLLPQHQMPNYIDPAQFKDQSDRRAQSLQTSPIPLKADLEKREVRIKGPSRIETMYATFSAEIKGVTDNSQEIVEQYGYSVFSSSNQNANLFSSPVGDSYILGPGDELVIRIWGKLENTMYQRIGDDGNIFLGKLGPAQLNGLSLREARRVITKIFEKDYTNISLSITVGTLRSIPIFVLGNVDRPGAYNVNSLATLIQALYISGGPTKEGSLRKIELRRRNGSNKTIDLYDYILNGNNKQDPKLVANDVIYVPTIGDVVKIDGGIKIPAIFEIKKTDNLHSLITTYSGGLSGNSYFDNITLERTIKGVRQLKTISVDGSVKALKSIALENGDSITIPFSNSKQANEIQVLGHVKSPGSFGISTGLTGDNKSKQSTLQDAIKQADGFMEEANLESIYISRLQADQTRKDIFINFVSNPNFVLDPNDIITVRHKERYISVTGAVKQSGKYSIESVSLLSDIIERAKGFEENAYLDTIHISRLNSDLTRSNLFVNYNETPTFNIQPYDTITVSFAKDYLGNQGVSIQGEVYRPNIYNYSASGTLKDLLLLAGVKESSELSNVEIYRKVFSTTLKSSEEKFILIDANTLLKTGENNINLLPDDSVFIRKKINADKRKISIMGEAMYPGEYYFEEGETLESVINRAGGFKESAFIEGIRYSRPSIEETIEPHLNTIKKAEKKQRIFEPEISQLYSENLKEAENYEKQLQIIEEKKEDFIDKELSNINIRIVIDFTNKKNLSNILPRNNDRIIIPKKPEFIHLVGGVINEGNIRFEDNQKLKFYVDKSGGYNKYADKKNIVVIKANGEAKRNPSIIERGDTIYIPEKINKPFKFSVFLATILDPLFKIAAIISVSTNL